MNQIHQEAQAELDAIRRDFESRLGAMIDGINNAWEQSNLSANPNSELKLVAELAHSLAGNAGFFGLNNVSRAARDLEVCVDRKLAATETCEFDNGDISRLIDNLRNASCRAANSRCSPSAAR